MTSQLDRKLCPLCENAFLRESDNRICRVCFMEEATARAERHSALAKTGRSPAYKYPFREMEIGESREIEGNVRKIRCAAITWGASYGRYFRTKTVRPGLARVTRVDPEDCED